MATRHRICDECTGQFSYEIRKGADRRYCSPACAKRAHLRLRHEGVKSGRCSVGGCNSHPRAVGSPYCDKHYLRLRRRGTLDLVGRPARERLEHSEGYRLVYAPGHPMTTDRHSHAYEHRVVFYDAHGPGPFNCHVCGTAGMLASFDVDHLNEVRSDNRLANLSPACPDCNKWRTTSRSEAARRQAHIRWVEHNGERLPLSAWAKRIGIKSSSLLLRIKNGWPMARALSEPRGMRAAR